MLFLLTTSLPRGHECPTPHPLPPLNETLCSWYILIVSIIFFSLKITAHPSVIEHCHKLSELGWLYRRINKYVEAKTQDPSLGLVVQVGVYNHTCTCTCVYYVYKQCICLCVYMYLTTVYMYIRDMRYIQLNNSIMYHCQKYCNTIQYHDI